MFNLDEAITEWRGRMLAGGVKTPVPLDELESHLQEDIEQQMRSGVDAEQAFAAAVKRIGRADDLKVEFEKLGIASEARRWKIVGITYSIFAVWISVIPIYSWLTVPKLSGAFSMTDRILVFTAEAVSVLSVLGWRWGCRFLPVIHNPRIRTVMGTAGCLLGVTGMLIIWLFIFPLLGHMRAQLFTILITWAWTAMAILGGAGHGLAEAALSHIEAVGSSRKEQHV